MKRFLFHNFRFIFSLDRWIRLRFTKAGRLVFGSLIAAGVFSVDAQQTLAYQLFSLLLVLLLFAMISSRFFKIHLTAQRDLPRYATEGETLHYQVQLLNHTPKLQQSLTLIDNVKSHPPTFENFLHTKEPGHEKRNWFDNYVGYPRWLWLMTRGQGAKIEEYTLPPLPPLSVIQSQSLQKSKNALSPFETSLTIKMTLTPLRRGYVHFTSITFTRPDPFGLFNAIYTIDLPNKLLVLPKRYPLSPPLLSGTQQYQRGGVQLAMSVGDAEEFFALREYRPGDPMRQIHWKSWAKVGKPIIKECHEEFFVRHALILDTFTQQPYNELFETAVSVAASLACSPRSHEVLLDLMFVGTQTYCLTTGRGIGQTEKLLEVLACVEACTDQPFSQMYPLVTEHLSSLSGCITILLNWDDSRQHLVQLLQNAGIPILVLIISQTPLEIDQKRYPEVQVLQMNTITA
jgi:uncharacterized protein (DUF58 family)